MSEPTVTYESKNQIAYITLNRPEKLNALNTALVDELERTWASLEDSEDRVAVLTGAGERAFSAGADLNDNPMNLFRAVPNVSRELSKPVIAAVHGHCIGGAYVLAQHCDLIIAADTTRFLYPETRLGFTGGIAAGIASRVAHKHAMEFLLLGEPVSGQRAYEIGMVNRVLPYGEHLDLAREWATRMRDSAPLVVRQLKRFADESVVRSPSEVAARTRYELAMVNESDDYREGLAAAQENRDAVWAGH